MRSWMVAAALPSLLVLAGCESGASDALHGYVETEPVRLAAPVAGRLLKLQAERGDAVAAGQTVFVLEQDNEKAAVAEADARVKQARAQAADLDSGKRPDELAVLEADLRMAETALRQSEADWKRQRELAGSGFISPSALDAYRSRRDADAAHVAELQAQLRSGKLAGREQSRLAAQAGADAARAQLAQLQWTLAQKAVAAPLAARVEDSFYRVGEWVPAGAPVLELLAPGGVKARFFVPEPLLKAFAPGAKVTLSCDGCGQPIAATVRFMARDAEYTPPMIYSKENRSELVWMAEAAPSAGDAARLRPGQPVDVRLAGRP